MTTITAQLKSNNDCYEPYMSSGNGLYIFIWCMTRDEIYRFMQYHFFLYPRKCLQKVGYRVPLSELKNHLFNEQEGPVLYTPLSMNQIESLRNIPKIDVFEFWSIMFDFSLLGSCSKLKRKVIDRMVSLIYAMDYREICMKLVFLKSSGDGDVNTIHRLECLLTTSRKNTFATFSRMPFTFKRRLCNDFINRLQKEIPVN